MVKSVTPRMNLTPSKLVSRMAVVGDSFGRKLIFTYLQVVVILYRQYEYLTGLQMLNKIKVITRILSIIIKDGRPQCI